MENPKVESRTLHYLKLQVRVAQRQYRELVSLGAPPIAQILAGERCRLAREALEDAGWYFGGGADHAGH